MSVLCSLRVLKINAFFHFVFCVFLFGAIGVSQILAGTKAFLYSPGIYLESVEGRSTILDKNFFERVQEFTADHYLKDLASSVGRLEVMYEGEARWRPQCTASLVSERYILTAYHCVKSDRKIEAARVRFGFLSEALTTIIQDLEFEYVQSGDGERVLAANRGEANFVVQDGRTGAPLLQPVIHREPISAAMLSNNGDLAAIATSDGRISIWATEVESNLVRQVRRAFRDLLDLENEQSRGLASDNVVTNPGDGSGIDALLKIRIANINFGKRVQRIQEPILELKVDPNGFKHAVFGVLEGGVADSISTSETKVARVWDAVNGDELVRLEIVSVNSVVWTHDGKARSISFIDVGDLSAVAISPTGSVAAIGTLDGIIQVFDLQDFNLVHSFESHVGKVEALGFNSTGSILVSDGADGSSRVWNLLSGEVEAVSRTWILNASPSEFSPVDELDYAIIEFDDNAFISAPTEHFEPMKLFPVEPLPGEELFVLHHPEGQELRATQSKCRALEITSRDFKDILGTHVATAPLAHRCDTRPGSSGAPIFNVRHRIAVGIHHAGVGRIQTNFAKRLDAIIGHSSIIQLLKFNERPPTKEEEQALRFETRFLTATALELIEQGSISKAMELARRALPNDPSKPNRPLSVQALNALYLAWSTQNETLVFREPSARMLNAIELSDGRILGYGLQGDIVVFGRDGVKESVFSGHLGRVFGVLEMSNGDIVSWSEDKTIRVWKNGSTTAIPMNWLSYGGDLATPSEVFELVDGRVFVRGGTSAGILNSNLEWDVVLAGHRQSVIGALQLKDERLLTWSGDGTAKIWKLDGTESVRFSEHSAWISGGIQLENGNILSWTNTAEAIIWTTEGKQIGLMRFPNEDILGAIQLSNGTIVTWSDNQYKAPRPERSYSIHVWSEDGALLSDFIGHEGRISNVIELGDNRILSWSEDGTARVWDTVHRTVVALNGHTDEVVGAFELHGRILTWSKDKTIRVWTKDGVQVSQFRGHNSELLKVGILSNGRILSSSSDFTLRVWSLGDVPGIRLFESFEGADAIELSGSRLLTWAENIAHIRNSHGAVIRRLDGLGNDIGYGNDILGGRELQNGHILTWAWDGSARLWGANGNPIATLGGHPHGVHKTFELQDRRIATVSRGPLTKIWSPEGNEVGYAEAFLELELNDGSLLFARADKLDIFDSTGKHLATLDGHQGSVRGALELSNGHLVTWAEDRTAMIWDKSGNLLYELEHCLGHNAIPERLATRNPIENSTRIQNRMRCIIWGAIEISGERFVTWGGERTAQIWHFDGTKGATLIGHCPVPIEQELNCEVDGVLELRGERLLTWSKDGTARIWSRNGEPEAALIGHCQTDFNEVCYVDAKEMSDGRIVTWSNDHSIIIWNSDGSQYAVLSGHCPPPDSANSNCRVDGVTELSDGRLLSSSYDGTVRFWPPDVSELLTAVDSILTRLEPLSQKEKCKYGIGVEQNCRQ